MSVQKHHKEIMNSEKYSRGRRGAPAKGVGRETGARVQIPLSPLFFPDEACCENSKKIKFKKLLTKSCDCGIINELPLKWTTTKNLDN